MKWAGVKFINFLFGSCHFLVCIPMQKKKLLLTMGFISMSSLHCIADMNFLREAKYQRLI